MTTATKPASIVIFGASGKVGRELTRQALALGFTVTVFVRREASVAQFAEKLTVRVGDITDEAQVRQAIRGKDAVLSALGVSRTLHHDPEVVRGVRTIAAAMAAEGVSRFIYLSVFLAHARARQFSFFVHNVLHRIIRKEVLDHEEKENIVASGAATYTIVRATRLVQKPASGHYRTGVTLAIKEFLPSVSVGDVAQFMLLQLDDQTYLNQKVYITGNG